MDYIRVTEAPAETITFLDVSFIKNIPSETFDLIRLEIPKLDTM